MNRTAAVITVSDKGARGERVDTSGPALVERLNAAGWTVIDTKIVPDEMEQIIQELCHCADSLRAALILTTGGTGFSPRDITPEATKQVLERETPGIPEAMRAASMRVTNRGCLSRSVAGIRGHSLIVNLPGSEKAARENLEAVLDPIAHGVDMLQSDGSADCGAPTGVVRAVCVSREKGTQKHRVDMAELRENWGIVGDAHAGTWHRQLSLLGTASVASLQKKVPFPLEPGAFGENLLIDGMNLYTLPVGTRLRVGAVLCEITQIGKQCHNDCAIRKAAGDCVMPREGVFARVLHGGVLRSGDLVQVL